MTGTSDDRYRSGRGLAQPLSEPSFRPANRWRLPAEREFMTRAFMLDESGRLLYPELVPFVSEEEREDNVRCADRVDDGAVALRFTPSPRAIA